MNNNRQYQRESYAECKRLGVCPKCRRRDRADEWSTYCAECKDYQTRRNHDRRHRDPHPFRPS